MLVQLHMEPIVVGAPALRRDVERALAGLGAVTVLGLGLAGGQAGLKRVRTRSGRYGMAGWSGTASLVPR